MKEFRKTTEENIQNDLIKLIPQIKSYAKLVAIAGGITPDKIPEALEIGTDVIIVGRYITSSLDVSRAAQDFLDYLEPDPDTMRLPLDEDESPISSADNFTGEYGIGEALVGEGDETAHVDVVIGEKSSEVGIAFLNAMANPSAGHTPLLAVIRPNLMTKPATIIVPKVTLVDMGSTIKVYGPAQTAIGRAVADTVEEGIIPSEMVEKTVIITGVYVDPQAEDYRKIYQYNYAATKLALKRAMTEYPPIEKIFKEKDRASHPLMGYKAMKLWNPPYIQVALDLDELEEMEKVVEDLPSRERILIEAGTPLIKKFGIEVIQHIRDLRRDAFIIADLKTLDTGRVEVKMAADQTADAVTISGQATNETIIKFIDESRKQGIYSILDMMNVENIKKKLEELPVKPDIVLLHQNIDQQSEKR